MLLRLTPARFRAEMERVGAHPASYPIFERKREVLLLKFFGLPSPGANVLKQEMLSLGGDAVVHRNAVDCKVESSDVILMGTRKQYEALVDKLRRAPYFGLPALREELERYLKTRRRILRTRSGLEVDPSRPLLLADVCADEIDRAIDGFEAVDLRRGSGDPRGALEALARAVGALRRRTPRTMVWAELEDPGEAKLLAEAGIDAAKIRYPHRTYLELLRACAEAEVLLVLCPGRLRATGDEGRGRGDPLIDIAQLSSKGLEEARSAGFSEEGLILLLPPEEDPEVLLRAGELEALGVPIAVDLTEAEGISAEDEAILVHLLASSGVSFIKPRHPAAAKAGLRWHGALAELPARRSA